MEKRKLKKEKKPVYQLTHLAVVFVIGNDRDRVGGKKPNAGMKIPSRYF